MTSSDNRELHTLELAIASLKRKLVNITAALEEPLGVHRTHVGVSTYMLEPLKRPPEGTMPEMKACSGPFEALFFMMILIEMKRQGKTNIHWDFIPTLKEFVEVTYAKEEKDGDLTSYETL